MRASLLWSMFQTEVACSTGHASVCAEVAQTLHRPSPVIVLRKQSVQSLWYRRHSLLFGVMTTRPPPPHSPGFWHCAHKHDSQDKQQAKRFCKPFMKHNEVFMEHIILKGKKLGHLGALWGEMKRSSSRRGSKGVPAVILKSFSFLSDTFSTDEKISFLMYVWQAPTAVY